MGGAQLEKGMSHTSVHKSIEQHLNLESDDRLLLMLPDHFQSKPEQHSLCRGLYVFVCSVPVLILLYLKMVMYI